MTCHSISIKRYKLQVLQLNGSTWCWNNQAIFTHLSYGNNSVVYKNSLICQVRRISFYNPSSLVLFFFLTKFHGKLCCDQVQLRVGPWTMTSTMFLQKFKDSQDSQTTGPGKAAFQYLKKPGKTKITFSFRKFSLESILCSLWCYGIKTEEVNSPHQCTEAFMFTSYQQKQELAEQIIFRARKRKIARTCVHLLTASNSAHLYFYFEGNNKATYSPRRKHL